MMVVVVLSNKRKTVGGMEWWRPVGLNDNDRVEFGREECGVIK